MYFLFLILILFIILFYIPISLISKGTPLPLQINFFCFSFNLQLNTNQRLMIKNVKCTLRQFPRVSLIHYTTRCCFPSPYSSCRVLILLDSGFFSWKKHTHLLLLPAILEFLLQQIWVSVKMCAFLFFLFFSFWRGLFFAFLFFTSL